MRYWIPALAFALLIFILSSQSSPPGANLAPDYVAHFLEYGVFTLTILWGVTQGLKKISLKAAVICFFISSVYAATDEFHQSFVPHRSPEWSDVGADVLGAATSLLITLMVVRIWASLTTKTQRTQRKPTDRRD